MTYVAALPKRHGAGVATMRRCDYCGGSYRSVRANQKCCGALACRLQQRAAVYAAKRARRAAATKLMVAARPRLCPRCGDRGLHFGTADGHTREWCVCGYEAILIPGRSAA